MEHRRKLSLRRYRACSIAGTQGPKKLFGFLDSPGLAGSVPAFGSLLPPCGPGTTHFSSGRAWCGSGAWHMTPGPSQGLSSLSSWGRGQKERKTGISLGMVLRCPLYSFPLIHTVKPLR